MTKKPRKRSLYQARTSPWKNSRFFSITGFLQKWGFSHRFLSLIILSLHIPLYSFVPPPFTPVKNHWSKSGIGKLLVKGQTVNIWDFVCHTVSVIAMQLCHKQDINKWTWYALIKLYLQKHIVGWFGPWTLVCWLLT